MVLRRLLAGAGIRGFEVEALDPHTQALVFPAAKAVLFAQDCPCRACEAARDLLVCGSPQKASRRGRYGSPKIYKPRPPPKERPHTYMPTSEEVAGFKARGLRVRRVVVCGSVSLDRLASHVLAFCSAPAAGAKANASGATPPARGGRRAEWVVPSS